MTSPTQITASQLSRRIGLPDTPIIIDVCIDEDFNLDPYLIPTAFRYPFRKIENLVPSLIGKKTIIICQKGQKLSQGAAAILRNYTINAESLEGGVLAWRDAGMPLISITKIPPRNNQNHTVWVTRHRPKIDRIACPWLIHRFIDPNAQFLFVEPSQVLLVAEKFDATPFDIDASTFTHHGKYCTFDILLEVFKLTTDPLIRLAKIIRGADTNHLDLSPQSSGLLAVSLGLSRRDKDDHAQLTAGMVIYDAFYRWARDAVTENHSCLPLSKKV